MSYVAFQYAEALFSLSLEKDQIDDVYQGYQDFVNALDTEIHEFLNHPKVSKKDKKEIIKSVVANKLLFNFISVLIDNTRIDHLDDCLQEFKKIIDHQNRVMNVTVYAGKKLSKAALDKLVVNLGKKHNRTVQIEHIVDPVIIGGLRIEFEGNVLDETINNYLHGMKANLTK